MADENGVFLRDGLTPLVGGGGADSLAGSGAEELLRGRGGDDALAGAEGDDWLEGGPGADFLEGGAGVDLLDGGAGDDRLVGGPGGDRFVFGIGDGADEILDFSLDEGDRLFLIPNLQIDSIEAVDGVQARLNFGGGDSVILRGISAQAVMDDPESFQTIFDPRGSEPGDGDTDDGDTGGDDAAAELAPDADGDLVPDDRLDLDALEYGGGTDDADRLVAGTDGAFLDAFEGDDTLIGGPGRDFLGGKDDDDVLDGGRGSDEYLGGEGADSFIFGPDSGTDLLLDFDSEEGDRIFLAEGVTVAEIREIDDFETQLFFGDGNAVTILGLQAETVADDPGDIFTDTPPDTDTAPDRDADLVPDGRLDLGSLVYEGGSGGDDLMVAGEAGSFLDAFGGEDTLIGGPGRDFLAGKAGDDTLFGGGGADEYLGGDGADRFVFGFGSGTDLILDFQPEEGDRLLLDEGLDIDEIRSVEPFTAQIVFDDDRDAVTIKGISAARLRGEQNGLIDEIDADDLADGGGNGDNDDNDDEGNGNDDGGEGGEGGQQGTGRIDLGALERIPGGGGDDTLTAGPQGNFLDGLDGDDTLIGGVGRDFLDGKNGDDRLDGGRGNDEYHGGNGADIFAFSDGEGIDRVLDWRAGQGDRLEIAEDLGYDIDTADDGWTAVIDFDAGGEATILGLGAQELMAREDDFIL